MAGVPARAREPAMKDVAALAGVSHQTVSRVLNDHPNVALATRARVVAAIRELGYRPNRAAKALVTGRTRALGVLAQPTMFFGPASMQAAFGRAATAAGYAVSVANLRSLDGLAVAAALDQLLEQRVAGIAVFAPVVSLEAALVGVPGDLPVVLIDPDPSDPRPHVRVDQVAGGRLATDHLLQRGHATVWHVSGPPDWFDSHGRVEGWRRALLEAGAEVPPLVPGDWTARGGYEAGQVLARIPELTAVFAANDHTALGLIRALTDRGRRVPEQISVVGFDDVPEAAYFRPPLTTVRQDFDALAQQALDLLVTRLDGDDSAGSRTIAPELVVRASAAEVRA